MPAPYSIHVWLANAGGFLIGELDTDTSKDDLPTYVVNAGKNGHTVIDKTAAGAVKPPYPVAGVDPAKTAYALTATAVDKLDAIALRIGLK